MKQKPLSVLILAAGRGTRMRSGIAKVLHPVLGRPMLSYVLDLARAVPAARRVVVVGFQWKEVAALLPQGEFELVRQKRLWGTGHAVRQARHLFKDNGDLLVLSGDTPLLSKTTLRRLLAAHRRTGAAATLLTAVVPEPRGYGRILREDSGDLKAIVEHDDASSAERRIQEVNSGVYCFENRFLELALRRLRAANRQEEFYLTDVIGMAVRSGKKVAGIRCGDSEEILGINDRVDLFRVQEVLRRKKLQELMRAGVTIIDPACTWVEHRVRVGADTVLWPQTHLQGETRVGRQCRLGPAVRVRDSSLGNGVVIRDGCLIEGSRIASGCQVGPFAHLRPGADLSRGVQVGNFVEVKGSRLGAGTKANHLSYLGDATLGRNVNIGAGTITCNYDGFKKWRTVIEDNVFVGSDTHFVAPVRIGKGALIGAGSTITRDVPPGTLALSRVPQQNKAGRAARRRKKTKSEILNSKS